MPGSEKGGVWKEAYPESFWRRALWVSKLVASPRFVGWDTGDKKPISYYSMDMDQQSRGRWLLQRCLSAAWCFLIIDAMNSYERFDPYFSAEVDIDAPLPLFLLDLLGTHASYWFMPRAVRILVFGLMQYSMFSILGGILAIIGVSLGALGLVDDFWGHPSYWPHLMGNSLVVFHSGLRGFWGRVWHQMFRHVSVARHNDTFCY